MAKPRGLLIALGLSWLSLTGCNHSPSPVPASEAVICHLAMRDGLVTVYSTPEGIRFTVAGTEGEIFASGLTVEELERRHPRAHGIYQDSIAGQGAPLDASLWPQEADLSPSALPGR